MLWEGGGEVRLVDTVFNIVEKYLIMSLDLVDHFVLQ